MPIGPLNLQSYQHESVSVFPCLSVSRLSLICILNRKLFCTERPGGRSLICRNLVLALHWTDGWPWLPSAPQMATWTIYIHVFTYIYIYKHIYWYIYMVSPKFLAWINLYTACLPLYTLFFWEDRTPYIIFFKFIH